MASLHAKSKAIASLSNRLKRCFTPFPYRLRIVVYTVPSYRVLRSGERESHSGRVSVSPVCKSKCGSGKCDRLKMEVLLILPPRDPGAG